MKGIKAAQSRMREMREQGIKVVHLNPVEKALKNPTSLRLAINGHCWQCVGSGCDGQKVARETIGNCIIHDCCLYPVRPYQNPS